MHDLLFKVWDVSEADFPMTGTTADKLRFLVNYAILAPSNHNSQPWLFMVSNQTLELYADRARVLAVTDPRDRELIISCGAALAFLRLAARYFGYNLAMQFFPDTDHPDLLARVRLLVGEDPTPEEEKLFKAIMVRRTNRKPFDGRKVPNELVEEMQAAAAAEGAQLTAVTDETERLNLATLIAQADHVQWSDKRFRNELAAWLRPNMSVSCDGIRAEVMDYEDLAAYSVPHIIRTFDLGNGQAAKDMELASGSPLLVVLATTTDTPAAWLAAGQALGRLLLHGAAGGIAASYLNQPIEIGSLRREVQMLTGCARFPQLILRMGYGGEVSPTTRRSATAVIM